MAWKYDPTKRKFRWSAIHKNQHHWASLTTQSEKLIWTINIEAFKFKTGAFD